jgi:hypothetical protein
VNIKQFETGPERINKKYTHKQHKTTHLGMSTKLFECELLFVSGFAKVQEFLGLFAVLPQSTKHTFGMF